MIEVLKPGFYSSIQDLGRFDYQDYGVPISGAMDLLSARLANKIIGNDESDAVLEITLIGPVLRFHCPTNICISGANLSPTINGKTISMNSAISVFPNDTLAFGKHQYGSRAYLAVSGGFKTEKVMGSRSMFKGITKHFRLKEDDILPIDGDFNAIQSNSRISPVINFDSTEIEVLKGPEFELLSKTEKEYLFSKSYTISKDNSRMAYQLLEIVPNDLPPIITSLVIPGTVQLTPAGKLIILMRDCQTTGGYPRVLQLKMASINTLSQKNTASKISFELVDL